ncbi:hypothetical protein L522_4165 [Bordetella bronchiseptica MBORD707]|nr:hypothetical protein L522_4165 [Bordetella bronchiseptica MBORD707]
MGAKTLDALNKLTQGALEPVIQAEQQRQYYEGMSAVAQGKSLLEIQKDQPWYTQIFGPSATVRGAQAMTLMSALDTAKADFLGAMPTLRTQPPDAVRKFLVDQVRQIGSTGDPGTDALVQAKLAEQWGPMLDLHTKQHVAYVQEQNVTAYGNGLVTAGDSYQQTLGMGAGFYTPEQVEQEKGRMLGAYAPIPGMTEDSWATTTAHGLQANLMRGNFGAYEAFKGSEWWQKLPLQARTQLERMQPYAVQWAQRNAPMFRQDVSDGAAMEVALSQGTGPQSVEQLQTFLDQEDRRFMDSTGSSTPKYDNPARARLVKMWYQGQEFMARQRAAAQEALAKGEAEQADAVAQKSQVLLAINSGGSVSPVAMNNISPDVTQQALSEVRQGLEQDGDAAGLDNWLKKLAVGTQYGQRMVDRELSERMTVDANNFFVQGAPITERMRGSLQYMQTMATGPNGMAGLSAYVGAENAAKMAFLMKLSPDLSDKSAVDVARQAVQAGWDAPVTAADKKAVTAFLNDEDPGFIRRNIPIFGPGALTGYDLNDASKARMVQDLSGTVAKLVRGMGMTQEQAVNLAFAQAYGPSSNVDFVDGTYVPGSPHSTGGGLFSTVAGKVGGLSQLSEDYQTAVRNVITRNMGAQIGKLPLDRNHDLTGADRAANAVARTSNGLLAAIPFVGEGLADTFDDTGKIFQDINTFDPESYVSTSGMATGAGVLYLTRVPKTNDSGMRSVTVRVSAQEILDELDAIRRSNAARKAPRPATAPFSDQARAMTSIFN